jgi:hypothetical protein
MAAPPFKSTPVQVLHRSEAIVVGEIGPLCAVIWRGDVTRERFELQRAGLEGVVRRNGTRAAFLCVVEPDVKPPTDELRKASSDMIESHHGLLSCVATVIEGAGFKAALTRSVLSSIALLMHRRTTPISFCATVSEAIPWIARHTEVDSFDMLRGVDSLRSRRDP